MNLDKMYEKLTGLVALEIFSYGETQTNIENEFSVELLYLNNMDVDLFSAEDERTRFSILRIYDVCYRNGMPLIDDTKYDTYYKIYESSFEGYVDPIMFEPSIDAWEKVEHVIPMGSLSKQTTEEEIEKWNKKANITDTAILISEKLDGISLSVSYNRGRFVRAVTRGNGKVGDDITLNAQYFDGIVKTLNEPWDCAVRGEVVITKENFIKINKILIDDGKDPLKNTRNGVSGLATKYHDRNEEILSLLTFIAYDISIFDLYETGETVV